MDRPLAKKKRTAKFYAMAVGTPAALALCLVFLFGFDWDAKAIDRDKIRIAQVRRGDLVVDVAGSGRVMPFGVEWVVARVPGVVTKVHAEAGDEVREGQLLMELTNNETDVQLAQTESKLLEARAMLSSKNFELLSQEMQLQSAVLQTQSSYEADKVIYDSYTKLMDTDYSPISMLEFLKAKVAYQQQEQLYKLSQSQLENFEKSKVAQLDEFKSRVRLAEHECDQYRTYVKDLKIVAAKAGVLQDFDYKVGQQITVGQNIGKIVDPQSLFVRLELPAMEANKIAKGQTAKIEVNRQMVDGVVTRIDPNVKGTTIDVDVRLTGGTTSAKVDMFVNARVIVAELKNTLMVARPAAAVENGVTQVYRLAANNSHAELVDINTGALSSNEMQVTGGLHEGDSIIISELNGLRGAHSVRIN
ncbi:MAG TPA: HlyD family efflux transporter periplasmic adaptor subunit [Steroidobacteraceae bacterium]|nr:HlyD family efflux transporter periplasmic adaptor subunit [Steroidobacteraceae bacterium]